MSIFTQKHFNAIASTIGNLPVLPDQAIQVLVEEFGEMFRQDNERLDFKRFQSRVTRIREGK